MEKIFITGTGRCGTTFLIKLFTFLNYDTGFNQNNYKAAIIPKCNAGMEKHHWENYYIIKNPNIIEHIDDILKENSTKIKTIIIPIRDYNMSAKSRASNGPQGVPGGLWNATNIEEQVLFYNKIMANYIYKMTKHNINTIFINFEKMVTDRMYLFEKLKGILDEKNISFELFSYIYMKISAESKSTHVVGK